MVAAQYCDISLMSSTLPDSSARFVPILPKKEKEEPKGRKREREPWVSRQQAKWNRSLLCGFKLAGWELELEPAAWTRAFAPLQPFYNTLPPR